MGSLNTYLTLRVVRLFCRVPKVRSFPDSRFLDTKIFQIKRLISIYEFIQGTYIPELFRTMRRVSFARSLLSKETIMQKTSGYADMHGCLETMQLIYVICNLDAETYMSEFFRTN
jgi:hypothetical protein